ncbi:hypothetical protein AAF712_003333 [Marasmius tenuissimus]|uniref:Uncharacterized protein n=1 Tax=Marasmius tenuissimus TaxID=585030 RepID=A0ABR3A6S3_9AGAR
MAEYPYTTSSNRDILTSVITIGQLPQVKDLLKRPRSPGTTGQYTTKSGQGPSDSQTVPVEDLRSLFYTGSSGNESATNDTLIQPGPLPYHGSSVPPSLTISNSANVLPSMHSVDVDPFDPISASTGGETGSDDPMNNFAAANEYMLQQPDNMWYTQATTSDSPSGNFEFTQEDLNTFMANVDDIVNGAIDYRWFEGVSV